jgi:hypothetical protein
MTDTPPAATPAPPTAKSRWSRWITFAAGIILLLRGALQIALTFTLPACGDKRATDTLHEIFKQQKVTINRITDYQLVTEGESDRTCSAVVDAPGEKANITYRIYWDGWTVKVMIAEVKSTPA